MYASTKELLFCRTDFAVARNDVVNVTMMGNNYSEFIEYNL